jgi:hypothetical protein
MNIVEIVPEENAVLFVRTEDGRAGLFDVKPYLGSEAFAPLNDRREFERLRNGKYFVEWDCGADLSADTILARWTLIPATAPDDHQIIRLEGSAPDRSSFSGEKSYDVAAIRREFNQAYAPWTKEDDAYLRERFLQGATIADLVSEFGRQPGGIQSRLRKLGLG